MKCGCDLVEVTAHAGARPEHAEWQGKVYSRSGKSKKYPPLKESTGYGTGAGLGGWNCRHSMFPYYEGTSRTYTDEELEELKKEDENDIINREIKSLGFRGNIDFNPKPINNIEKYSFDDEHINKVRNHKVTKEEAKTFIDNAKISVTRWNGKFVNYYGYDGATYVNTERKEIKTSFKSSEYDEMTLKLMEVLKKYGK